MAPADFDEKSPWGILKATPKVRMRSSHVRHSSHSRTSRRFSARLSGTLGARMLLKPPKEYAPDKIRSYWFCDRASGRRVFAYWLAIPSNPKDDLKPVTAEMTITDKSITQPVLMDIRTGDIQKLRWSDKAKRTISVPLKDSVMAVADARFLDWVETPQAPAELVAERSGEQMKLHWKPSPGALRFEVERSTISTHGIDWAR